MPVISETLLDFVLQYGELASHWGLNKTEAQIHGLLFVSEQPLNAEDMVEVLSVGRSHVSQSLKELQQWGIIRPVHIRGDRREHYESMKDVWELFRTVVSEQKRREIDPVLRMLETSSAHLEKEGKKADHARQQILDMLDFFKIMTSWYERMKGMPLPMVKSFLKMGSKAMGLAGKG